MANEMGQILLGILHTSYLIFKDQSWGGIGAIVGIVFFFFERRRESGTKAIAHVKLKHDSLTHPRYGFLHSIHWKLWNCGNEHIASTDYEYPIKFTFGNHTTIVHDARVYETEPVGRKVALSRFGNAVVLTPLSLQDDESITLEFLVTPINDIQVDLRIAGKSIDVTQRREKLFRRALLFRNILLLLLIPWFLSLFAYKTFTHIPFFYYLSLVLVFLIVLLATLSLISHVSAVRGI